MIYALRFLAVNIERRKALKIISFLLLVILMTVLFFPSDPLHPFLWAFGKGLVAAILFVILLWVADH
ncbi:MAG: hypothetical protein Q8P49_04220 [Candidatus Liptonbacteria bacterium]|nr:hypothetical protein [Candidatus Liptonbacteria bacterium]